jgi:uncharacterized protein with GYD domain
MGFFKDIKDIKDTVNVINENVNSINEKTLQKSIKYDDVINKLKTIKIKVKRVYLYINDGKYDVKVEYELPTNIIQVNKDKVHQNEMFTNINTLNLISMEDMIKIAEKVEEAKIKNGD